MRDDRPGTVTKPKNKGAGALGAAAAAAAPQKPKPKPQLVSEHGMGQQPNKPAKPSFGGPFEPPNPLLQKIGFNGGIQAFNNLYGICRGAADIRFGFYGG